MGDNFLTNAYGYSILWMLYIFACVAQLVVQRIRNEQDSLKKSAGCTSDVEISIN